MSKKALIWICVIGFLGIMFSLIIAFLGLLYVIGFAEECTTNVPNLSSFREDRTAFFTDGDKAVDYILIHADTMTSLNLLAGASTAFQLDRLEDAAFLLYAGRIRVFCDTERFVSTQTGGDSPGVALGGLMENVREPVGKAVTLQPKVYAKLVERMEAWNLRTPEGYDPGWPYKLQKTPDDLFAKAKADWLGNAKILVQLLALPEYVEAMKTARAFNELPLEKQEKDKAAAGRYAEATKTMQRLEKQHNVRWTESSADEAAESK